MKNIKHALVLIVISFSYNMAIAEKWSLQKGASAEFHGITSPGLVRIVGTGAEVTGNIEIEPDQITGQFEADLSPLDTGIGRRDRDMKEKYLEIEKYPKATLHLDSVELPKEWRPGNSAEGTFKGRFVLKEASQPVSGEFQVNGEKLQSSAEFKISLKDYPIKIPSFLGVTVDEEVHVKVKLPGFEKVL